MKQIKLKKSDEVVMVIGSSACGKSALAEKLNKEYPEFKLYSTDSYKKYGFRPALYKLILDLSMDTHSKKIIEGVQGVRLLRKGLQNNDFHADVVVVVHSEMTERIKRYKARGEEDKIPYLKGFDAMLGKIFKDYLDLLQTTPKRPRIITINV